MNHIEVIETEAFCLSSCIIFSFPGISKNFYLLGTGDRWKDVSNFNQYDTEK